MAKEQKTVAKKPWYKKWWVWVIIVFILIIATSSNTSSENKQEVRGADQTDKKVEVSNEVVKEDIIEITAQQLASEYEQNEVAADQKYKGKILRITGVVNSIGKDILDAPYVALSDGKEYSFSSVQCLFNRSHEDELVSLLKGQTVTLQGKGNGYLLNTLIKDCRIAKE